MKSVQGNHWKFILIFLLMLFVVFGIGMFGFRDTSPAGYERSVGVFEGRKRVDQLCTQMPSPIDSRLVNKSIEGSTQVHAVSYNFESSLQINDLKEFYSSWFESNGWVRLLDYGFRFQKEGQIISIAFEGMGRYSVNCSTRA